MILEILNLVWSDDWVWFGFGVWFEVLPFQLLIKHYIFVKKSSFGLVLVFFGCRASKIYFGI